MTEPTPVAPVTVRPPRRGRLALRSVGGVLVVLAVMTAALASSFAVRANPAPATPAPTAAATATPTPTASPGATVTPTPLPTATPRYSGSGGIITNLIFGPAIDAVAGWITGSAVSAADDVIGLFVVDPANPDLRAPWFLYAYYGTGAASGRTGAPGSVVIAAWLMLLVVLASVMSGVIRGDIAGMVRLVCVRLPVAVFVTYIAIWLVTQLLAMTDLATTWEVGSNAQAGSLEVWSQIVGSNLGTDFLTVLACLVLIAATVLCYLELLARDAAIYVVAAFIPLIAVASLWPGAHNALKRGAETLFVLCISKFVMAFVLVLGAGALTASVSPSGNLGSVLAATLIFLLAALAPFAVFRLLPLLEATAIAGMVGYASGIGKRVGSAAVRTGARAGAAAASGGTSEVVGAGAAMGSRGSSASPTPGSGPGGMAGQGELKIAGSGGQDGGGQQGGGPVGGGASPGGSPADDGQSPSADTGPTLASVDTSATGGGANQPTAGQGPSIASTPPWPITPQQEGSPA